MECRSGERRSGLWAIALAGTAVWAASLWWFSRFNPSMGAAAAGGAVYAALLTLLTVWLAPRTPPEDRLRVLSGRPGLSVWWIVAGAELCWVMTYGIAFGGVGGGVRVPLLTPRIADLSRWQFVRGVNGTTLLNFVSLGLLPACVMLTFGARPRELGLVRPVRGTRAVSVAWLALPTAFVVWGFSRGKLTGGIFGVMLLHNLLSNGFPEEAQCRGLFLAPLRTVLPTAWAVLIQGLLFGLIHFGGAIPEEGGDYVRAAAASVALNFPMGVALGVVSVRTGSLALPIVIHVSLHVMKDLVR